MSDDDLDSLFSEALAPPAHPNYDINKINPSLRRPDEADLWRVDGVRLVFHDLYCVNCHSMTVAPEGFYIHKTHARNHCEHLERVELSLDSYPKLQREVHRIQRDVPFCVYCFADFTGKPV